ncbi:MAG: hypothetical protein RM347_016705 [Nostoc sp. ChiQUE02]|uniref:hypothetical protein n=1 Tax=Nostoc sp. ChiQUE02 TaxID=3075377 RepID=UPI002AD2AE66|nr:hypothetical protein [Nostoc sp. ChiQUE02]
MTPAPLRSAAREVGDSFFLPLPLFGAIASIHVFKKRRRFLDLLQIWSPCSSQAASEVPKVIQYAKKFPS